jgi:hypothetical protein
MVELNATRPTATKSLRRAGAQVRIDRSDTGRREVEGVAVGFRLGDELGPERAVGARPALRQGQRETASA